MSGARGTVIAPSPRLSTRPAERDQIALVRAADGRDAPLLQGGLERLDGQRRGIRQRRLGASSPEPLEDVQELVARGATVHDDFARALAAAEGSAVGRGIVEDEEGNCVDAFWTCVGFLDGRREAENFWRREAGTARYPRCPRSSPTPRPRTRPRPETAWRPPRPTRPPPRPPGWSSGRPRTRGARSGAWRARSCTSPASRASPRGRSCAGCPPDASGIAPAWTLRGRRAWQTVRCYPR